MPQNIFKIYDGRTNFWQWDTNQKLIVLDDRITEVHFSNRDMNHSIPRQVYEKDDMRMCNIPDIVLQLPRNLVAYAYADGATIKSVKFAVIKRPIPEGYVMNQEDDIDEKLTEIDIRLDALSESKADNIYYDEDGKYVQLVANGELIGDRVELKNGDMLCVVDCKINEDGHLVVTFSNGSIIDAGYVSAVDGVTFTPHISDDLILSWTNNGGLENPESVDISPFNDWVELGDGGEASTQYAWEFM
jgi:hypothetical protein